MTTSVEGRGNNGQFLAPLPSSDEALKLLCVHVVSCEICSRAVDRWVNAIVVLDLICGFGRISVGRWLQSLALEQAPQTRALLETVGA